MAVLVLSVCESDNKENIPPFSSKQITLVSANKRRRVRHPLQDITNLLKSQVEYSSPLSLTNATSLVSFQSNRRKEELMRLVLSQCSKRPVWPIQVEISDSLKSRVTNLNYLSTCQSTRLKILIFFLLNEMFVNPILDGIFLKVNIYTKH